VTAKIEPVALSAVGSTNTLTGQWTTIQVVILRHKHNVSAIEWMNKVIKYLSMTADSNLHPLSLDLKLWHELFTTELSDNTRTKRNNKLQKETSNNKKYSRAGDTCRKLSKR